MKWVVYTPLIVFGIFALLFAVEKIFPLRESRAGLLARLIVNGAISLLTFALAMLIVRPSAISAQHWAGQQSFGIVHWLGLTGWAEFVVAFLFLDLTFYYWHILNHRIPWLWRFHNVHHIDPDLDVSTGFRFHFGEVLLSTLFRVVQVVLIGVPFVAFAAYELVFQAGTLFHHSNLRLPIVFERWLSKLIVTPRMHGIHHSQVRNETNSNFGVVFPWWDGLHRTIGLNIPQSQIEIGIPGYSTADDNRLGRAFVLPFVKQRNYWQKPDGTTPQRNTDALKPNKFYLAE
jgi:sterol desaturase/sphingolipid hydroxylase (fatty acid hydroxylase superfamily)